MESGRRVELRQQAGSGLDIHVFPPTITFIDDRSAGAMLEGGAAAGGGSHCAARRWRQ